MTVEEKLHDAMHARAAGVEPPEWDHISARLEPRRRAWPMAATGFAVVAIIVLLLWVAANGGGGDDMLPASGASYPARAVGATYDGRLVVLSARDGRAVRTLADDVAPESGLAVSPDGQTVYYPRTVADTTCDINADGVDDPVIEVARVSIAGGPATPVMQNVRFPAISPDGRYLAVTGVPRCSDAGSAIIVRDLRGPEPESGNSIGDADRIWSTKASTLLGLSDLAWAPDSQHLLFGWRDAPGGVVPRILDTSVPRTWLDDAPRVPIGDSSAACCYRGDTGSLLGNRVISADALAVMEFDPSTGKGRRLLCCASAVASDRTGRALLVRDGKRSSLARWVVGERRPTSLSSSIATAVWVPQRES